MFLVNLGPFFVFFRRNAAGEEVFSVDKLAFGFCLIGFDPEIVKNVQERVFNSLQCNPKDL